MGSIAYGITDTGITLTELETVVGWINDPLYEEARGGSQVLVDDAADGATGHSFDMESSTTQLYVTAVLETAAGLPGIVYPGSTWNIGVLQVGLEVVTPATSPLVTYEGMIVYHVDGDTGVGTEIGRRGPLGLPLNVGGASYVTSIPVSAVSGVALNDRLLVAVICTNRSGSDESFALRGKAVSPAARGFLSADILPTSYAIGSVPIFAIPDRPVVANAEAALDGGSAPGPGSLVEAGETLGEGDSEVDIVEGRGVVVPTAVEALQGDSEWEVASGAAASLAAAAEALAEGDAEVSVDGASSAVAAQEALLEGDSEVEVDGAASLAEAGAVLAEGEAELPGISGATTLTPGGAAGVYETLGDVVRNQFEGVVRGTAPAAHDNFPFTPPDDGPWVRVSTAFAPEIRLTTGHERRTRSRGTVECLVHVPLEDGSELAFQLADLVGGAFEGLEVGGASFGRASFDSLGAGDGAFGVLVSVPFHLDHTEPGVTGSAGMPTWETAGDAIRSRFKAEVEDVESVYVLYDNFPDEHPDDAPWVRWIVKAGQGFQVDTAGSRHRTIGAAIAEIWIPLEDGDERALQLVDVIVAAFRSITASGITYRVPEIGAGFAQGRWWRRNVTCPFYYHEVAA